MKGLYFVTDRGLCGDKTLADVVLQAIRGGAACVQLREKDVTTRFFVEEALQIKALLASFKVPLIINDRLDVALAVEADGVHVGQEDMPYEIARKLMGPRAIIGLSVETWEDVERAQGLDVDYLGVSPVFATPTKTAGSTLPMPRRSSLPAPTAWPSSPQSAPPRTPSWSRGN
jgi:thiamine-phosphate pyrophosphorylase